MAYPTGGRGTTGGGGGYALPYAGGGSGGGGVLGGAGGIGGGGGFAGLAAARIRMAPRKPGLDPYMDPSLGELGGPTGPIGPGGEVRDPEGMFGTRGRDPVGYDQLRGYGSALAGYRGRPGMMRGGMQGENIGSPSDMIRKLLLARQGALFGGGI